MIKERCHGEISVLLVSHSVFDRSVAVLLMAVAILGGFFYFKSAPTELLSTSLVVVLLFLLLEAGLWLFSNRLVVGPTFVEERGLARRKRVALPPGVAVELIANQICLRGESGKIAYRFARGFNKNGRLENRLREFFSPTGTVASSDEQDDSGSMPRGTTKAEEASPS